MRPGHIYGPGFKLGCFPEHSRQDGLLSHIREGKPLPQTHLEDGLRRHIAWLDAKGDD